MIAGSVKNLDVFAGKLSQENQVALALLSPVIMVGLDFCFYIHHAKP